MVEDYLPIPLISHVPIFFKIMLNVLIFNQKYT